MPSPNDLAPLADALDWLNLTEDTPSGTVARLITSFSTRIQKWLGYNILQANYTRTFNGQGLPLLFLPDLPVVSVSSLIINGQNIPQGVASGGTESPGYYNDEYAVFARGYHFRKGFRNITVSYVAGYEEVPQDLEQACLTWLQGAYFLKANSVPTNATMLRAGDTAIQFTPEGAALTNPDLIPIPAMIYATLVDYQRKAQISGF